jgi:hypothetical protein
MRAAASCPAQRMLQLGLAGKRVDQRAELTSNQPVEVRDVYDLSLLLLFEPLEHRSGEQLGEPWHPKSVSQRTPIS